MEGKDIIIKIIENPSLLNPDKVPSIDEYDKSDKFYTIINEKKEFGEKILVVGHEDIDGISSLFGMHLFLKSKQVDFETYLPSRENEAHGISDDIIEKIKKEGFDFLITVDCGLSNEREIKLLREIGVDVFVIDHHSEGNFSEENLIHPFFGKGFPFLSTGVLIFLILFKEFGDNLLKEKKFFDFVYLAGLSVLSDKMPNAGPNEFVLKKAQEIFPLTHIYKILNEVNLKPPGFKEVSKILSSVPAQNGTHPILEFLKEDDENKKREIMKEMISKFIEEQGRFEDYMHVAKNSYYIENNITYIISKNINPRYAGWIASRFLKEKGFPAICISKKNNEWVGEARSNPPFSILKVLKEVSFLFEDFGGHPFACGFSIKEENLHPLFENLKNLTKDIDVFIPEPDLKLTEEKFHEKRFVLENLASKGIYFTLLVNDKYFYSTKNGLLPFSNKNI